MLPEQLRVPTFSDTEVLKTISPVGYITPTFADLDGDRDLDMMVGVYSGEVRYFRNDGNLLSPDYNEVTLSSLSSIDVGRGAAPVLADFDKDGDYDLVIGAGDGTLHYYKNSGDALTPNFVLQTGSYDSSTNTGSPFDGITVSGNAYPAVGDMNYDGKLDVLVGDADGFITYLLNTGTVVDPAFSAQTGVASFLDGIDFGDDAAPALGDIDGDTDVDLIVGNAQGTLTFYLNGRGGYQGDSLTAEVLPDDPDIGYYTSGVALVDTGWNTLNAHVDPFAGLDLGDSATVFFADLDGDGDNDLVTGDTTGAIKLMRSNAIKKLVGINGTVGNDGNPHTSEDGPYTGLALQPLVLEEGVINPDGWVDINGSDYSNGFTTIKMRTSTISPQPLFEFIWNPPGDSEGNIPYWMHRTTGDLNGDGKLDFVTIETSIRYTKHPITGYYIYDEMTTSDNKTSISYRLADDWNDWGSGGGTEITAWIVDYNEDSPELDFGHVSLADLDADGDLDLVVGVSPKLLAISDPDATVPLAYFENTGDATNPVFVRRTSDAENLVSSIQILENRFSVAPDFADLDGDGDLDCMLGNSLGEIEYWRNVGTAKNPQFTEVFTPLFNDHNFAESTYSTQPLFADFDKDGDYDLLVYETNRTSEFPDPNVWSNTKVNVRGVPFSDINPGEYVFYRNEGTPRNPNFTRNAAKEDFDAQNESGNPLGRVYFRSADTWPLYWDERSDINNGTGEPFRATDGMVRLSLNDFNYDGLPDVYYMHQEMTGSDSDDFRWCYFYRSTGDDIAPTATLKTVQDPPYYNRYAFSVQVTFDELVDRLALDDFALTDTTNNQPVDISGAILTGSGDTYILDFSALNLGEASYNLTLVAANSIAHDAFGNAIDTDTSLSFDMEQIDSDLSVTIVGDSRANFGDALTYDVVVKNEGITSDSSVQVSLLGSPWFSNAQISTVTTQGGASSALNAPVSLGDTVQFDTVNLPVGGIVTYSVSGTVAYSAVNIVNDYENYVPDAIQVNAQITSSAGFSDEFSANDQFSSFTIIEVETGNAGLPSNPYGMPVTYPSDGSPMPIFSVGRPYLKDINNDGYLDIILVIEGEDPFTDVSRISYYINDQSGGFGALNTTPAVQGFDGDRATFGDIDNDGDMDIVLGDGGQQFFTLFSEGTIVYLNDGATTPSFTIGTRFHRDEVWYGSANLVDVDGDGDLDLFTSTSLHFNDGTGTFGNSIHLGVDGVQHVGDLNGDGLIDFIASDDGTFKSGDRAGIFLQNAVGTFDYHQEIIIQNGGETALGDIDNDGDLDFIKRDNSGRGLYLNDGSGSFSKSPFSLGSKDISDIALGDLNGDGWLDILLMIEGEFDNTAQIYPDGNEILYLSDGAGGFDQPIEFATDFSTKVALGDLDKDGTLDLVMSAPDRRPYSGTYADIVAAFSPEHTSVWMGDTGAAFNPVANAKPVISLPNGNSMTVFAGETVDLDSLATATDAEDGDLTNEIVYTTDYNQFVPGVYTVDYTVFDSLRSSDTETLTITVISNQSPVIVIPDISLKTVNDQIAVDASGSYDPDGHSLVRFNWTLVTPNVLGVTINDPSASMLSVSGLSNHEGTTLEFELTVTDSLGAASLEMVTVTYVSPFGFDQLVPDVTISSTTSSYSVSTGSSTVYQSILVPSDGNFLHSIQLRYDTSKFSGKRTITLYRGDGIGGEFIAELSAMVSSEWTTYVLDSFVEMMPGEWFTIKTAWKGNILSRNNTYKDGTLYDPDVSTFDLQFRARYLSEIPAEYLAANLQVSVPDDFNAVQSATITGGLTDPNADDTYITYLWEQILGASVTMTGSDSNVLTIENLPNRDDLGFRLTATDTQTGLSGFDVVYVAAHRAPIAVASVVDAIPTNNTSVTLDATGSSDPDGKGVSYLWELVVPDAQIAISDEHALQPVITGLDLAAQTENEFLLTVTDGQGATSTASVTVIYNQAPTAVADSEQAVTTSTTITLDGSSSSDLETGVLSYSWVETSGKTVTFDSTTIAAPQVSGLDPYETYEFELTVTDENGRQDTDTVTVRTFFADAGEPIVTLETSVILDAMDAYDTDGAGLIFSWIQTDDTGPRAVFSYTNVKSPTVSGLVAGESYEFELTVISPFNLDPLSTDTVTVIAHTAPIAVASVSESVVNGNSVTLLSTGSNDPEDGTNLTYEWTNLSTGAASFDSSAANPVVNGLELSEHYTFKLVVTDSNGSTAEDTVSFYVNAQPIAQAGGDIYTNVSRVALDGTGSSDAEGGELIFFWEQISGETVVLSDTSIVNPEVSGLMAGQSYEFELTVTDDLGAQTTDTVKIYLATSFFQDSGVGRFNPEKASDWGDADYRDSSVAFEVVFDYTAAVSTETNPIVLFDISSRSDGAALVLHGDTLYFFTGGSSSTIGHVSANHGLTSDTLGVRATAVIDYSPDDNTGVLSLYLDGQLLVSETHIIGESWSGSFGSHLGTFDGNIDNPRAIFSTTTEFDPTSIVAYPEEDIYFSAYALATDIGPESNIVDAILVSNRKPFVEADYSDDGIVITLDGTGSFDLDSGDILAYSWALVSPVEEIGNVSFNDPLQAQTTIEGLVYGVEYTFSLSVTDSVGQESRSTVTFTELVDRIAPVISLNGASSIDLEAGVAYVETVTASDAVDGDLTSSIVVTGSVDESTLGEYMLLYNVSDAAGNAATVVSRTVTVIDTTAPVLSLVGDATIDLELNASTYVEQGATFVDAGDTSVTIVIGGDVVDTTTAGTYVVTYNAIDASGNVATELTRTVIVSDTISPLLSIVGDSVIDLELNASTYVEQGATVSDAGDGSVSVVIGGDSVDTTTADTYVVTYDATDASGNSASTLTRTVTVADTIKPVLTLVGEETITLEQNVSTYTEQGAGVSDVGDSAVSVVIGGDTVDVTAVGTYIVTYNATDASGNAADEVTRTVIVEDTIKPVLSLVGDETINLELNVSTYTEEGVSITEAGDTTLSVTIGGDTVDTTTSGTYVVTYDATDASGNVADQVTRTVIVEDTIKPVIYLIGEESMILAWKTQIDPYVELGATVTDVGDSALSVVIGGDVVDTTRRGTYTVTYNATDASGNVADEVVRTVLVDYAITFDGVVGNRGIANFSLYTENGFEITKDGTPGYRIVGPDHSTYNFRYLSSSAVLIQTGSGQTFTLTAGGRLFDLNAVVHLPIRNYFNGQFTVVATTVTGEEKTATISVESTKRKTYNFSNQFKNLVSVTFTGNQTSPVNNVPPTIAIDSIDATILPPDTEKPVLALVGDVAVNLELNASIYTELGATVTDDSGIALSVDIGGDAVDTTMAGTYVVTYNAIDYGGNVADEITRTVIVSDTTKPVVSLIGDADVSLEQDTPYTELGATVADAGDSGVSVVIGGDAVDVATAGTYVVTYNATDASGNVADEVTRTVTVIALEPFEKWLENNGIGGGSDKALDDGTLIAFLTGQDPNKPMSEDLVTFNLDFGAMIRASFRKRSDATEYNPVLEYSNDLVNWATAVDGENGVMIEVEEGAHGQDADGVDIDAVHVMIPKNDKQAIFTRITVSRSVQN